jgi:L,D-transpeptidase catalytic domain
MWRLMSHAIICLAALLIAGVAEPAGAMRRRETTKIEIVESRPVGTPLMAIVSLSSQKITIYDAEGWVLRAPVSSGQTGYETPAGIYSVLQKEEEHTSNLYDDASMPFMQRITWSGISLHAGELPGYPASHGCVRMPYEFAERLFDMTKIGMRVIVARNDVRPEEIAHPALFKPKPVRADFAPSAPAAHWDNIRADGETVLKDVASPASPAEPLVTLKSIAEAKVAQGNAAAVKAEQARMTGARMSMDALRLTRAAEIAKSRAEVQLREAEGALDAATAPLEIERAGTAKSEALARLEGAEAQLSAAKAEAESKADAASRAREDARAAEAERIAALKDSQVLGRVTSPVSVFISRKTQRLYVRQGFEPVLEIPVAIRDADEPIGTHIYTVLDYANSGRELRWSAVSMDGSQHGASAALERIQIPQDVADRISEVISPGSSLIISDEGMSAETGKDTDFVILMSGEPQGGIKIRRHDPEARYNRQYDYMYGRPPAYAPPFYNGGPFVPW